MRPSRADFLGFYRQSSVISGQRRLLPPGGQFDRRKNFTKKGLSTLVRPTVGVSFQKRGRDRKDFAQGAIEATRPEGVGTEPSEATVKKSRGMKRK
jgi:hypothetical protein